MNPQIGAAAGSRIAHFHGILSHPNDQSSRFVDKHLCRVFQDFETEILFHIVAEKYRSANNQEEQVETLVSNRRDT